MVANLILEAAGTAGMLAAEVTKKPDTANQEKQRTMIQAAIYGPKKVVSFLNTIAGKAGILGLNLSVSSALRQSQAFTAMVSTLFQLAGMFLDMAFAPLIPGIARMLKDMAGKLPGYADFIEVVSYKIQRTFDGYRVKFSELSRMEKFFTVASAALKATGAVLGSLGSEVQAWFWKLPKELKIPLMPFMVTLAGILGISGDLFLGAGAMITPGQTGTIGEVQGEIKSIYNFFMGKTQWQQWLYNFLGVDPEPMEKQYLDMFMSPFILGASLLSLETKNLRGEQQNIGATAVEEVFGNLFFLTELVDVLQEEIRAMQQGRGLWNRYGNRLSTIADFGY